MLPHPHDMIDRLPNWAFPPALMGLATGLWSVLQGLNWYSIAGLCLSAGWLRLAYLKHRLNREQFEASRPAPIPRHLPYAGPDGGAG